MALRIKEVPPSAVPMELLLLADPSVEKVKSYLRDSRCFVACSGRKVIGACAVKIIADHAYELMNIAVAPAWQQRGVGTQLLKHVIKAVQQAGAERLEVGTGSFGYQLAFYQRQGFRVSSIERDFFINSYDEPVFESGIPLKDMLRLTLEYPLPAENA